MIHQISRRHHSRNCQKHPQPEISINSGDLGKKNDFTLIQRILLAQKGTIENVLCILAGEKIGVRVISQSETNGIISRKSILYGIESNIQLIEAISQINSKALPEHIVDKIRAKVAGIGKIIDEKQLETYIRINRVGMDERTNLPFRRYLIFHDHKPAIKILERILI